MAVRITSELESTQTYDFLFDNDNKLDEQDIDVETDLHEIDIFGNNHHIAMGAQKTHPENSDLFYYIAYLIFDSKVVSKIGVYETDKRLESMTHRTMNFALHDLLVDSHYYKNPNSLMAFVNTKTNKDKGKDNGNEEEKETKPEEDEDEEEGEIDNNKEEGEIDNDEEQKTLTLQDWLNIEIKSIQNPKINRVYNILRQFKKNQELFDPELDESFKEFVEINPSTKKIEITDKFYFNDKNYKITKSIIILYEYVLNVKFIIINADGSVYNFSILDSLNEEKMNQYYDIKNKENLKNLSAFKNFNPLRIVLLRKDAEKYMFIRELNLEDKSIVSEDDSLLKKIKIAFDSKPREHNRVDATSFAALKESFKALNTNNEEEPRTPSGPPPNALNVNAGGAAAAATEEVPNEQSTVKKINNSINIGLGSKSLQNNV